MIDGCYKVAWEFNKDRPLKEKFLEVEIYESDLEGWGVFEMTDHWYKSELGY